MHFQQLRAHLFRLVVAPFLNPNRWTMRRMASVAANMVCFYLLEDSDLYSGERFDVVKRRSGRSVTEEERQVIKGTFFESQAEFECSFWSRRSIDPKQQPGAWPCKSYKLAF